MFAQVEPAIVIAVWQTHAALVLLALDVGFNDPAAVDSSEEDELAAFRRIRDEISERLDGWRGPPDPAQFDPYGDEWSPHDSANRQSHVIETLLACGADAQLLKLR